MARLTLLAALVVPLAGTAQQDASEAIRAAGVCARCHVISVVEWGYSKHLKAGTGCVSCHGESRGHVADERNNVKPERLPRGAEIAGLCVNCHTNQDRKKACQTCHHPHALADPRKPPSTKDERLEQLEARREKYDRRMQEGERAAAARRWDAALAEFRAALAEEPGDRAAAGRARMCERRMNPGLPGFEIAGAAFDDATGLPRQVRVAGQGIPMLLVPGGEADIGSERFAEARPVHTVRVEPFYLGRHEVTQAEWKAVMGSNPSAQKGDLLPVEQVSWEDAQAFVTALNARAAGGGFRLPTEAEWEFAARAGGEADEAYSLKAPRAVESGRPNRLGLFDLGGNVREWCSSLLAAYPYDARDGREDARAPGLRVLRGAAFSEPAEWYDRAARHGERPGRRMRWNGLRLARSVPEQR